MADAVRRVDYYYATLPNRAGQGARILDMFRKEGVNLLAVHAFPDGNKAQIDFFPEDSRAFLRAAKKADLKVSPRRTAFLVRGKDRIGAVARVLGKLGDAGINVTALDAVATGDRYGALVWVRRDKVNRAARVLGAKR